MSYDICSCSDLRRLTRKITTIYDHYLIPNKLTITQYSLISSIGRLGPVANLELAIDIGMSRSTLSRTLKPLISRGWVTTVDLPKNRYADRRSFALILTALGQRKLEEAWPNWRLAQDEVDRQLGPGLSTELDSIVDSAYAKLREPNKDSPPFN